MMKRINIQDQISPLLLDWKVELSPAVLHKHIARAEERLFQDHIGALPPNRLGKSTGFWADAARSTHAEPTDIGCVVSINKVGFRQRYYGGEIKPVNKTYLTLPARGEFYGARAREFTNLRFVLFKSGSAALVIEDGGAEKINSLGSTRSVGGKKSAGMVAFWLVKSVRQQPDPGVIPSDKAITNIAVDAAQGALQRAKEQSR